MIEDIRISHGFDELNNWWWFNVDSRNVDFRVAAADRATKVIAAWCEERWGPPSKEETSWYVSEWRSFTIPDPTQAMEFRMRWSTPD